MSVQRRAKHRVRTLILKEKTVFEWRYGIPRFDAGIFCFQVAHRKAQAITGVFIKPSSPKHPTPTL